MVKATRWGRREGRREGGREGEVLQHKNIFRYSISKKEIVENDQNEPLVHSCVQ